MKIKLDENIPVSLAESLRGLGHDVHTVHDEGLAGTPDSTIWSAVQAESRFLITQDLDFSDQRTFAAGSHFGVLLVRLQEPGRLALLDAIFQTFREEDVESWERCFVVLTERKVRVRRPS